MVVDCLVHAIGIVSSIGSRDTWTNPKSRAGWRFAMYPLTVVLDTVQLPWGVLAGLFGD